MVEGGPILEIGLVLLVAAVLGAALRRFSLPAVVGYLLVGVAVSGYTPGFVADREQLQVLADVGVVMLLFEVGIELDLRALRRHPRGLLGAAPLQVALTIGVVAAVLLAAGIVSAPGAFTIAVAVALSSSVVVINITRSRRRTIDDQSGRTLVVWAILQDVLSLFVVAILASSLLPGGAGAIPLALGRLAAFAIVAGLVHAFVVPRLLRAVREQPDTFLAIAVSVALATAGIGSVVFGVPLALAAFVAGTSLGLRDEAREARAEVLPFRDLFAITFFVAVGTLLDPGALWPNIGLVLLVIALVGVKGLLVWGLAKVFRVEARHAQLGVGLAQIGEFSFVVLGLGLAAGAITAVQFSAVLGAAVLTIVFSTIAVRLFPRANLDEGGHQAL